MKRIRLIVIVCSLLTIFCARMGRGAAPLETPDAAQTAEAAPDGRTPAVVAACTDEQLALLEQSMSSTLAGASAGFSFTLMLESADGRSYLHSEGASTGATPYESASTSKRAWLSLEELGQLPVIRWDEWEVRPTNLSVQTSRGCLMDCAFCAIPSELATLPARPHLGFT